MSVKKVVLALLLEEEEEDELFLTIAREPHADMFRTRRDEGFYNLLIHGHLKNDPIRFRSFFRLNVPQFTYILSLVEYRLYVAGCNRVPYPIAAEEKLALTLR
ncbi:hypothetical protein GE061_000225 [Apolygus lucorum]|uniref:Uncharacterized protein n=1 Tax=Apolygus lucorum TaxID=248454 RepID=A0A8S9Y3N5_APOLU|nr:hypothetical protein GE061_000225 [Apolygus lucorum]